MVEVVEGYPKVPHGFVITKNVKVMVGRQIVSKQARMI